MRRRGVMRVARSAPASPAGALHQVPHSSPGRHRPDTVIGISERAESIGMVRGPLAGRIQMVFSPPSLTAPWLAAAAWLIQGQPASMGRAASLTRRAAGVIACAMLRRDRSLRCREDGRARTRCASVRAVRCGHRLRAQPRRAPGAAVAGHRVRQDNTDAATEDVAI